MKRDWMRTFAWALVTIGMLIWGLGLTMSLLPTPPKANISALAVFMDGLMLGAGPFALGVLLLAIRRPRPRAL